MVMSIPALDTHNARPVDARKTWITVLEDIWCSTFVNQSFKRTVHIGQDSDASLGSLHIV